MHPHIAKLAQSLLQARGRPSGPMPPKKAVKGAKAKKQQGGKAKSRGAGNRRNNPKAFAAASGTKAQAKNAYRTLEKQERKYHISLTDRSVDVEVRSPSRSAPLHCPALSTWSSRAVPGLAAVCCRCCRTSGCGQEHAHPLARQTLDQAEPERPGRPDHHHHGQEAAHHRPRVPQ